MSYTKNQIPIYILKKTKERKPFLEKVDEIKYSDDDDVTYVSTIVELLESKYEVSYLYEERIYVVSCDNNMNVIGITEASKGCSNSSKVPYKEIMMFALLSGADQVLLFHNHPDGNLVPSQEDEYFTMRLSRLLEMIDIRLPIHAIIADDDYKVFWNGEE